eukprot:TRINITY_DN10730_c0_g1_i1.p1 TRINITY_DN10730_c0_g1~~TRINITY_DN10730_c0_g1_i1.p1  ORF type:complete len:199 (-),score=45.55 TRINITY_DN10730_c0_g1_i1:76-651(-)
MSAEESKEEIYSQVIERILECQNDQFVRKGKTYYEVALDEIKQGEKVTHWIWYVFPCPKGVRTTSRPDLEIANLATAQEYLKNTELRKRLLEITSVAYEHIKLDDSESPAHQLMKIFGSTDAAKYNETVTFFAVAAALNGDTDAVGVFSEALRRSNGGNLEEKTMKKLNRTYRKKYEALVTVNDLGSIKQA